MDIDYVEVVDAIDILVDYQLHIDQAKFAIRVLLILLSAVLPLVNVTRLVLLCRAFALLFSAHFKNLEEAVERLQEELLTAVSVNTGLI